jgi:hypothetical protein
MEPVNAKPGQQDLVPTGECWCGCDSAVGPESFFAPGHDKIAESAVVNLEYGSVARLLVEHGYGPDGKNARVELASWRSRGGTTR